MSEEYERQKLFYFVMLVAVLVLAYIFLLWFGFYDEAKFLAELISILVIALASYYLGYSKTKKSQALSQKGLAQVIKRNINTASIFFIILGLVLITIHTLAYGFSLTVNKIFLNHVYIGIYCLGCGLVIYGISKKIEV